MKEKTMTRPTKDMTKTAITREQLLALLQGADAMRALLPPVLQAKRDTPLE